MIEAANVIPNFANRRNINAPDLKDLQEAAVIYEGCFSDSDGAPTHVYTVAGWLNGVNIFNELGGATVGGDVILIDGRFTRGEADMVAGLGLNDTIDALNSEEDQYLDALAAQARLATLRPLERMALASKPDSEKNPEFESDASKLRLLAGDDVILAAGRVAH